MGIVSIKDTIFCQFTFVRPNDLKNQIVSLRPIHRMSLNVFENRLFQMLDSGKCVWNKFNFANIE